MDEKIYDSLQENMDACERLLGISKSFDLISRRMTIGGKGSCLYFVDGFIKDEAMLKIMDSLYGITSVEMPDTADGLVVDFLPYIEVELVKNFKEVARNLFSGVLCLFIDGYEECIAIDCRTYPARGVEEPQKDKVLRGSRDGFVETVVFNTALIRRRIRDTNFRVEMLNVGRASKTDVVVCYMDGRADMDLVAEVKKRVNTVEVDALTMNQESLAECLYKKKWYNPFPKFKYTERPDTAAACILEGNIAVLVDNSPSAMIIPTSIFDIIEEADDYYFPPITGTYLRSARFLIALLTLFLTPVFLLFMQNPQWIPEWLAFIAVQETVHVPLILQFLILELAVDGLKLAALNTPSVLSTPLSIIAALVLGELSVKSGWFNSEVMVYMSFVALANYTQASLELGYALKFMRILMLLLTCFFNLWGFVSGVVLSVLSVCLNKTVAGKSYIYPLFPFDPKECARRFFGCVYRIRMKKRILETKNSGEMCLPYLGYDGIM